MLVSFQIKNSRSILDLTIPLTYAEKKAPNGYKQMELQPFLEEDMTRTVPCLAIYGANTSGKSNIIKAFSSLTQITNSKYDPKSFSPNKLHPNNDSTSYALDFIKEGRKFRYILEIDSKEIVNERLEKDSECVFSIKNRITNFTELATEVYPSKKLDTIFSVECLNEERQFRTPFITVVGKNYAGLDDSMTIAYSYITNNLEVYANNNFPFTLGLVRLAKTNGDVGMQKAFEDIVTILRKLDIDITRMEYKQDELNKELKAFQENKYEVSISNNSITTTEINSYHKDVLGNDVQFNFKEESLGTQRVACLLGIVLTALRRGNVLVIDELGNSLHPYLFAEIVRMFKDKRYNTSNAQLIFTTHNTDIMEQDMMRVSEIGIVNRTLKRGTTFRRVSDFEGVRNVTNFRKQYLDGNFSGIPHPYI
ncbi:MAG: ATP-binding protein [Sphaerochaeta sp.]|nr:ATP-binding protein [Sphaerochaeta sp.]